MFLNYSKETLTKRRIRTFLALFIWNKLVEPLQIYTRKLAQLAL